MENEGMEALLDFPDFGAETAPTPSEGNPLLTVSADEPESSTSTVGKEETVSTSIPPEQDASAITPVVPEAPKKKKKRPHDAITDDEPPLKHARYGDEQIHNRSQEAGPSREAAGDDEHDFPSEQDFESDFLDLMPFKEEDPEDVAERQKLQLLISHLSEEQLNRYEVYRRASFPKASVRRIMQTVSGSTVSQNAVIAMVGIAKMHVGEIVEQALDVKEAWGDVGPIQPQHLREALRKLRNRATVTSTKYRRNFRCPPYP